MWDSGSEVRRMRTRDVGFSLESFAIKNEPIFVIRNTSVRVWHKAVFRWVWSQGQSPHASVSSKDASGSVGIPLMMAPQAPGDTPNPSEED